MGVGNSSIYPTVETILNRARVLVNDAYNNGAGRVLTDIAPFTVQYLNMAINRVQFKLANEGVQSFWRDNVILTPILPVTTPNSGTQITVGYQGSDFGSGNVPVPSLPNDLIIPWDLWERPTGSTQAFRKMYVPQVALPSRNQQALLREWQWAADVINMVGATQSNDIRLRYEAVIPEISPLPAGTTVAQAAVIFSGITVSIRMGAEALAQRIAYFYATSRGDETVAQIDKDADAEVDKLILMSVRGNQRHAVRRRGFRHGRNISDGMIGMIS